MTDTVFGWAVIASVGTHVAGLAAAAAFALGHGEEAPAPIQVPIEVVRVSEEPPAPPPPVKKPERQPALRPVPRVVPRQPEPIQPSKPIEDTRLLDTPVPTRLAETNLPANAIASQPNPVVSGPREGGSAGAGQLFSTGDLPVGPGRGVDGGSGGSGRAGAGPAAAGTGDAVSAGVTSFARPLGGYQTTPRYPESARTAGIEGISVLRFVVQADGLVGTVNVEKSAGHTDLDRSAIEAVKSWRFEPARRGKEPVAVWVTIPVRFQLTH